MSHKSNTHSDFKVREAIPIPREKDGKADLMCPFCVPSHPLNPGVENQCGTVIQVKAVQSVMNEHAARQRDIKCLKCHETRGGEFVKYMNGWIHLKDCRPDTKLMPSIPKLSFGAQLVYKIPDRFKKIQRRLEKITGVAKRLEQIDENGKHTGKVLGYFFWREA